MNLDQQITQKLCILAKQFDIDKLVLFGSRARGDNHTRSDIDLAIWGIVNAVQYLDFQEAVEEQVPTLLSFDLVDMNGIAVSDVLRNEVRKEGIILYEKV